MKLECRRWYFDSIRRRLSHLTLDSALAFISSFLFQLNKNILVWLSWRLYCSHCDVASFLTTGLGMLQQSMLSEVGKLSALYKYPHTWSDAKYECCSSALCCTLHFRMSLSCLIPKRRSCGLPGRTRLVHTTFPTCDILEPNILPIHSNSSKHGNDTQSRRRRATQPRPRVRRRGAWPLTRNPGWARFLRWARDAAGDGSRLERTSVHCGHWWVSC